MVRSQLPFILCTAAFAACDTPGVTIVRPETQGADPTPTVVHVTLEDSAMAEALGWEEGVPDAAVIIQRFIDPFSPDTMTTDSTGRLTLSGVVPGWYMVAAHRRLDAGSGAGADVFGDGVKVNLPTSGVSLRLRKHSSGSLVISEFFQGGSTLSINYSWAQFFELYNNADTVVFVDGMILGRAYSMVGLNDPCQEHEGIREDPLGLWTRAFHQFPGNGTEYSVVPGSTVVIALDGIDHSVVDPTLPDLSIADFEFEGTGDADNPDIPNMKEFLTPSVRGHGMLTLTDAAHFIALPVDVTQLPRQVYDGTEYVRIPAARVLDVLQTYWMSESSPPPFPLDEACNWVNRDFDRLEAPWYRPNNDNRVGNHRRILGRKLSGDALLQDTNTSFLDWVLAPYSPGRVEH